MKCASRAASWSICADAQFSAFVDTVQRGIWWKLAHLHAYSKRLPFPANVRRFRRAVMATTPSNTPAPAAVQAHLVFAGLQALGEGAEIQETESTGFLIL